MNLVLDGSEEVDVKNNTRVKVGKLSSYLKKRIFNIGY